MANLKLNFYTEDAKNIVEAAMYYWSKRHHRTWFARAKAARFDDCIAPDGSLCIIEAYASQNDIWVVANAIKCMLRDYNDTHDYYEEDKETAGAYHKYPTAIDLTNRQNDVNIFVKKFKYSNEGYRMWYDYEMVKINVQSAWIMYDLILNHRKSTIEKTFSKAAIDAIVGKPRNPMEVEQAKIKGDEVTKIKEALDAEISSVNAEINKKINDLRTEQKERINKLTQEADAKILKLEEAFNEMKKLFAIAE